MFKKNSTASLPELSRLIGSVISKRQGDRRKYIFLERKKKLHKRENGFTVSTQNITSMDGSSYEAIHSSISQIFFHISKSLACNAEKLLQLNITKKKKKKKK